MGGNPGAGASAAGQAADTRPWYEQRQWTDPALKAHLQKSGYHMGTEAQALELVLKGEAAAVAKLGKVPGSLLDAPAPGQKVADWMRANGKALGVPEDAAKYALTLPADLPEGTPLDGALLAEAQVFGHAAGMPPEATTDSRASTCSCHSGCRL